MINWAKMEELVHNNLASLIFNSEYNFDSQVIKIADEILANRKCRMILIAGPSASGKTTFTNLLANRLEYQGVKVHRISTDDFFLNRETLPILPSGVQDFDSINAMDCKLLSTTIKKVLQLEKVQIPTYDFILGERTEKYTEFCPQESDIVIVEGIHALNPILLGSHKIDNVHIVGVHIEPGREFEMPSGIVVKPNDIRLLRRFLRDCYSRGHSLTDTLKQWTEVLNAEKKYIRPFVSLAGFHVDSVYDYELLVYKRCLGNILDNCDNPFVTNIREALKEVEDIPSLQIPETSLLNEFVKGGIVK